MENQKRNEEDFWLLQYQKLIDSRPADHSAMSEQLDPQLGYQLLLHGVIHCLPFLAKLLQTKCMELCDVTDDALTKCGVRNEADRKSISKAIWQYSSMMEAPRSSSVESCEVATETTATVTAPNAIGSSSSEPSDTEMLTECVVCMENSVSLLNQFFRQFNYIELKSHSAKSYSCLADICAAVWTAMKHWSTAQCADPESIVVLKLFKCNIYNIQPQTNTI